MRTAIIRRGLVIVAQIFILVMAIRSSIEHPSLITEVAIWTLWFSLGLTSQWAWDLWRMHRVMTGYYKAPRPECKLT